MRTPTKALDPSFEMSMIETYAPFVKSVASRTAERLPASVRYDDLYASGLYGLLQAIRSYNPANGRSFLAFASPRIYGAMMDDIRASDWVSRSFRRGNDDVPRMIPFSHCGEPDREFEPVGANGDPSHEPDMRDLIEFCEARLPEKEARVFLLIFRDGYTMLETARVIGLSEGRVCQIVKIIRARLQNMRPDLSGRSTRPVRMPAG